MKKSFLGIVLTIVFVTIFSGCAHKITIAPDTEKISTTVEIKQKPYNIGYFIEDITLAVITGGGGGDRVTYQPYKETESALVSVLSKHFQKVYKIENLENKDFINKNNLKLIFTYKILTNSSSQSLFTWPPTNFIITLTCKAVDKNGNIIWKDIIKDEGSAEFDEFKNDFSLSAKRASENVFKKLLVELNNANELEIVK